MVTLLVFAQLWPERLTRAALRKAVAVYKTFLGLTSQPIKNLAAGFALE